MDDKCTIRNIKLDENKRTLKRPYDDAGSLSKLVDNFQMKKRLAKAWLRYVEFLSKQKHGEEKYSLIRDDVGFTEFQKSILIKHTFSYSDLSYLSESLENSVEIREILCLHVLNHLYLSKDTVSANDAKAKVKKRKKRAKIVNSAVNAEITPEDYEEIETNGEDETDNFDSGFTKPRILLLFPTRILCLRFIKLLFKLIGTNAKISNKDRFLNEFVDVNYNGEKFSYSELDFLNGTHPLIQLDKQRFKGAKARPIDFLDTFESNISNIDNGTQDSVENEFEAFKLGFALRDKKNISLYTNFFKSDVIVATPLSLRVGANIDDSPSLKVDFAREDDDSSKEEYEDDDEPIHSVSSLAASKRAELEQNFDYLSSIEVCVVIRSDLFAMQNIAHLIFILNRLCQKPKVSRSDTDFSRIRPYFLDNRLVKTRYMQLILTSKIVTPLINSIINSKTSIRKSVKIPKTKIKSSLKSKSLKNYELKFHETENKLKYFEEFFLNDLLRDESKQAGLLIVASSYFDFVILKNKLETVAEKLGREYETKTKKELKLLGKHNQNQKSKARGFFACLSEYSPTAKISKLRADFLNRKFNIMLISERFHFYFRYHISGVQKVFFYDLTLYAESFRELLSMAQDRNQQHEIIFGKESVFRLERILGTKSFFKSRKRKKKVFEIILK